MICGNFTRALNISKTHIPLYNHFGSKINKNEACRKLGIHPSKKNLLFFGLIPDYKGLDLLIEAMGQLNEDYHLIIAASYGSFEKYQALIDASPAKERIFVHCEYISDEEIPFYFSAADALVLPYRLRHSKWCRICSLQLRFTYVKYSRRRFQEQHRKAGYRHRSA